MDKQSSKKADNAKPVLHNHISNKLKKQKRRLFVRIALSLLIVTVIVFSAFAVTTYYSELDILTSRANSNLQRIALNDSFYYDRGYGYYTLNKENNENIQVIVTNLENGAVAYQTEDAVAVEFSDDTRSYHHGCIEFEQFRSSMTDEQYREITDYLKKKTAENDEYYELVCTEFYPANGHILPKTVEIVQTSKENEWYAQDKTITRYELNPKLKSKSEKAYKCDDMKRNVIEDDFVLGKYKQSNVINEYNEALKNQLADISEDENTDSDSVIHIQRVENVVESSNDEPIVVRIIDEVPVVSLDVDSLDNISLGRVKVAPFTYIFENSEQLLAVPFNTSEPKNLSVTYAEKFNVLESCGGRLLFMLFFTIALFLTTGIIIGAITWRTLKKQIEQENRLRTVTNAMAHELKTPLFIISGFSENLAENIHPEKREHYAELIGEQIESMNGLVTKMIDYSKLDSLAFTPSLEQFSLSDMTKEIIDRFDTDEIVFYCNDEVEINADKKLLDSAIENLIDNALKYSVDNRPVTVMLNNGMLSVSNPCKAVTKAEIADMWQPYHRLAESSQKEGHGLGLAIVKSIFELHKFSCGADYSDGIITFWFRFKKSN